MFWLTAFGHRCRVNTYYPSRLDNSITFVFDGHGVGHTSDLVHFATPEKRDAYLKLLDTKPPKIIRRADIEGRG